MFYCPHVFDEWKYLGPMLARLCVIVGSGTQLCVVTFVTLVIAMFGMLSPASRGSLLTAWIVIFMLVGYVDVEGWKLCTDESRVALFILLQFVPCLNAACLVAITPDGLAEPLGSGLGNRLVF